MVLGTYGLNFIFPRPPLILLSAQARKNPHAELQNGIAGDEYVRRFTRVK
jgi:hypothetical protein